jgi:hypothetical protein
MEGEIFLQRFGKNAASLLLALQWLLSVSLPGRRRLAQHSEERLHNCAAAVFKFHEPIGTEARPFGEPERETRSSEPMELVDLITG